MSKLIIYGASGHGKVVYDVAKSNGITDIIFYDDDYQKTKILNQTIHHALPKNTDIIIAVGNNQIRKKIALRLSSSIFPVLKSKTAIVSEFSTIEKGTVIFPGSVVNASCVIGQHVIINTNAVVEHDCVIDDFVHISPNATVCGTITIGEGTQVGAGATILPNLKIGKWCKIGAGAVVVHDIPDYSTVIGVPGRIKKH